MVQALVRFGFDHQSLVEIMHSESPRLTEAEDALVRAVQPHDDSGKLTFEFSHFGPSGPPIVRKTGDQLEFEPSLRVESSPRGKAE